MVKYTTEYEILHFPQFKKQLSGKQIESLLNFFLYRTLLPLFPTLWFKNQLALLIFKIMNQNKKKIIQESKDDALNSLFDALVSLDKEVTITHLKECGLDKSLLIDIAIKFLKISDPLLVEEENFFNDLNEGNFNLESSNIINNIQSIFYDISKDFLIKVNKEVNYWYDKYIKFRQLLVSKYYRLAYKYAKITKMNKESTDIECLFKSLLLSIETALNRYTSDKGTLASYIQLWFKSTIVNPEYWFELGSPFRLSNYGKQKIIDRGSTPNALSTDDEEFSAIESKLDKQFLNNSLEDFAFTNFELLEFINSIQNPDVELVRIILNIPKLAKK